MKTIRNNVSNWRLIFDDGSIIEIAEVQEQKMVYYCEKLPQIKIKNATINNKLIEKIINGIKLFKAVELYNEYAICDTENCPNIMHKKATYNCTLDNIEIVCKQDEYSVFNIVLIVNYEEDK